MFKIKVTENDGTRYELQEIPDDRLMGALYMADSLAPYKSGICIIGCFNCPLQSSLYPDELEDCTMVAGSFYKIDNFEIV